MKSLIVAIAAFAFVASPALAQNTPPPDTGTDTAAPAKPMTHHATHHRMKKHHTTHCTCRSHHKTMHRHHTTKVTSTTNKSSGK